jgi:hypothetical protein
MKKIKPLAPDKRHARGSVQTKFSAFTSININPTAIRLVDDVAMINKSL